MSEQHQPPPLDLDALDTFIHENPYGFVSGVEARALIAELRAQRAAVAALRAERDAARAALAGLVGCIDGSAADNGPPVTRGSVMAQVCKVLQKTMQYDAARDALLGLAREEDR